MELNLHDPVNLTTTDTLSRFTYNSTDLPELVVGSHAKIIAVDLSELIPDDVDDLRRQLDEAYDTTAVDVWFKYEVKHSPDPAQYQPGPYWANIRELEEAAVNLLFKIIVREYVEREEARADWLIQYNTNRDARISGAPSADLTRSEEAMSAFTMAVVAVISATLADDPQSTPTGLIGDAVAKYHQLTDLDDRRKARAMLDDGMHRTLLQNQLGHAAAYMLMRQGLMTGDPQRDQA